MTNLIEDFYAASYVAGELRRATYKIFVMPSQSGKSLTTFRFWSTPDVLILPGDYTAQSLRNALDSLYKKKKLEELKLIIIEDWSKIREGVRDGIASIMAMIASGMYSMAQQDMSVEPTKMTCSIVINVPTPFLDNVIKTLNKAGTGGRFSIFQTSLSSKCQEELDYLGILNMDKTIKQYPVPETKDTDFLEFYKKNVGNGVSKSDINFCYACECIREGLYKDLKAVNKKFIKEIKWDAWDDIETV